MLSTHDKKRTRSPAAEHNADNGAEIVPPTKKAHSDRCIYGNFAGYKCRRGIVRADPRLDVLPQHIFYDKRVLDIGCNCGDLLMAIAGRFQPLSVLGIDIDARLIREARRKVKKAGSETTAASAISSHVHSLPISFSVLYTRHRTEQQQDLSQISSFPNNIDFRIGDILDLSPNLPSNTYDTITCFSVTKWIHLHHGDTGIQTLFREIFRLLVPGGTLVLEPQPWSSYRKRKNLTEVRSISLWINMIM